MFTSFIEDQSADPPDINLSRFHVTPPGEGHGTFAPSNKTNNNAMNNTKNATEQMIGCGNPQCTCVVCTCTIGTCNCGCCK